MKVGFTFEQNVKDVGQAASTETAKDVAQPQKAEEAGSKKNESGYVLMSVNLYKNLKQIGLDNPNAAESTLALGICDSVCDGIICDSVCDAIICDEAGCDTICAAVCETICDNICDTFG